MNAHSKDLPMDRTERRRLTFYHQLDQAMRGALVEVKDKPLRKLDLPQLFEKVDGVVVDLFGHETPTPEQMEKLKPVKVKTGEIDSEQGVSTAYRVTDGSSLARLLNRGVITETQWRAGEAYQAVWFLAGIDARQTGSYGQSIGGGETTYGMAPTEIAAHYRKKLRAARVEMGPKVWPHVEAVAIEDKTLRDVGWTIRQNSACSERTAIRVGRVVVCEGLDILVDLYGIQ